MPSLSAADRRKSLLALFLLVPMPTLGVLSAMAWEPTRGTPLGQAVYIFSKLWILVLPAAWLMLVDRQRPGLSPARQGGLSIGALSGMVIALGIGMGYWFIAHEWVNVDDMRAAAERNGIGTPGRYLVLVIGLTFLNSMLEEYVWRWFVFRKCETLVGGSVAIVLSGLFFTLHHIAALKLQAGWDVTLLANAGVFIGGCTWSWLYLKYRSIWPGWISHVLADIAVFAVGWHILFVR